MHSLYTVSWEYTRHCVQVVLKSHTVKHIFYIIFPLEILCFRDRFSALSWVIMASSSVTFSTWLPLARSTEAYWTRRLWRERAVVCGRVLTGLYSTGPTSVSAPLRSVACAWMLLAPFGKRNTWFPFWPHNQRGVPRIFKVFRRGHVLLNLIFEVFSGTNTYWECEHRVSDQNPKRVWCTA